MFDFSDLKILAENVKLILLDEVPNIIDNPTKVMTTIGNELKTELEIYLQCKK